jgi:hypothetical protein
MTDIAPWRIETPNGDITADFLDGALFDTAPGSMVSPTFAFVSDGVDTAPSDRHAELQTFVDAAQERTTIRVGTTSEGKPYYREELSGYADVDSLLVALVPEQHDRGAVWAVLRGGSDETPSVERDVFVWSLELTVLERYDSADSRTDIENAYSDEVL